MQPQMNLFRKAAGDVVQRHDFLGENLWPIISGIDLTDDEDGFALDKQLAITVVVFIHAKHLHGAFQIFQGDQ